MQTYKNRLYITATNLFWFPANCASPVTMVFIMYHIEETHMLHASYLVYWSIYLLTPGSYSDSRPATVDLISHPWLRSAFLHVLRVRTPERKYAQIFESSFARLLRRTALSASSYLWCYCFSHSLLSLRSALLWRNNANLTETIFPHQTWWKFKSLIILCTDCFYIFCDAFYNKTRMNPVLFMKITCENFQ